ncbi:MAG TPA: gluconokinase [Pyrinomonadaceae bacterium]
MKPKLILGLDIGTSSVRAGLYDERGDMLRDTFVKNERALDMTDDGGFEIDAAIAFKQVVRTVDDVLAKAKKTAGDIEYAASCAFWHSLVGVDKKGNPTTKVLGWGDTRSRMYSSVLKKRFDEAEVHNRTGARFHSSFWPAKLLWLRSEFPKAFARTALWLSFSDFVALRLFGVAVTSVSMASGTGIFDIRAGAWDAKLIRFLAIKAGDLPLVSDGSYTYPLLEKFRRRWPRLKPTGWFPAIGDGAANNVGSGCMKRSQAALMIGTSGALRSAFEGDPPKSIPRGLWCYRVDRRRVIIGGALSDGGGLYRWMLDNFQLDGSSDEELANRAPDSHGLTFLPFLGGERSTGYNEQASGGIVGLRSSSDAVDIAQAALESVAFRFAEIFDQLYGICKVREIFASGGALRRSTVWPQILADVLGRNLYLSGTAEASMRGAVLLALETTGRIKKLEDASVPASMVFAADKSRKVVYQTARRRHQELYKLLIDQERSE